MAQPQAYNRTADFTEQDGDATDHVAINVELDAAAVSINALRTNLTLIQRDDGALKNGIVTAESLADSALQAASGAAAGYAATASAAANSATINAAAAQNSSVSAAASAIKAKETADAVQATGYSKAQADDLLLLKSDKANTYTKDETFSRNAVYNVLEADALLAEKANASTMVNTTSNQTIGGAKTFSAQIKFNAGAWVGAGSYGALLLGGNANSGDWHIIRESDGRLNFYTGVLGAGTLRATFGINGDITAGGQFLGNGSVPPGAVMHLATSAAPAGWLKANGAAVSRFTYSALFAAIGTVFGAGNGVTTFNLPDLRGEFVRGWDDGRGVDSGRAFGSGQSDEIKSHSHAVNANNVGGRFTSTGENGVYASGYSAVTASTGGAETRPRNIALLACIKY